MLSLRARILVIFSFIVLAILAISLLIIVVGKNKKSETADQPINPLDNAQVVDSNNFNTGSLPGVGVAPTPTAGLQVKTQPTEEAIKNGVKQLAKIFIERYGSYSTQNDYQNVLDVKSLSTPVLWQKLSASMNQPQPAEYLGMTTLVISSSFKEWNEDTAIVTLETLRTEEKNNQSKETGQAVEVFMIKQGDNWLVNNFQWK